MQEYLELDARVETCHVAVNDARFQVQSRAQDLTAEIQRFSEMAHHLLAWKSILAPQLRLLDLCGAELRNAWLLRMQLQSLEKEYVLAEDRFDIAQIQLRKHQRHEWILPTENPFCSSESFDGESVIQAAQNDYEHSVTEAGKMVESLARHVQQARNKLQEFESTLPLMVVLIHTADASAKCVHQVKDTS